VTSGNPFGLSLPRIGADESGKGDFFGPLVVASFHLDSATEKALKGSGITDSKKLTDPQILRLAGKLDKLGRGHVISLMPEEYNPEYNKIGNLNVLLSRLHGRCISELAQKLGAPKDILVDQFSPRTTELKKAINPATGTRLHTRTKAEADLAVAAASILARAEFLDGIKELESDFGVDFPTGAGSPVIKAGRAFKRGFGSDGLPRVAKVHFKTIDSL
jgi:ribonuclease HIII